MTGAPEQASLSLKPKYGNVLVQKKYNSFKTVTFSGFEASRFTLSRPVYISHRGVGDGWEDVQLPTQLLTDQLTLSQPEEADCPPRFR